MGQVELEFVDEPGYERQLLCRPNRTADADRVIGGRLPPGMDVFQGLSQIEVFQRVVEDHLKAGP